MQFIGRMALVCGIAFISVTALNATSLTYDYSFGGISGIHGGNNLNTPLTVNAIGGNGPSITALGYALDPNAVNTLLYSTTSAFNFSSPLNNGGVGMGTAGDNDDISYGGLIVLNLTPLTNISSLTLYMDGSGDGNGVFIWGSTGLPNGNVTVPQNSEYYTNAIDITGLFSTDKFVFITAENVDSDILLGGLTAVAAPEPAYPAVLGGTLLLCGLFRRRRRASQREQ